LAAILDFRDLSEVYLGPSTSNAQYSGEDFVSLEFLNGNVATTRFL